jgi:hypothetical protein
LVGGFAARRVINPRLGRSQYCGGMIWGVSFAPNEHAVMDLHSGLGADAPVLTSQIYEGGAFYQSPPPEWGRPCDPPQFRWTENVNQ